MAKDFFAEEEANKTLLRKVFDAMALGDTVAVNACLSEDMVLKSPAGHPLGGTYTGIADIEQSRALSFAALGITKIAVNQLFAGGPHQVFALLDVHGTDAEGAPWFMPAADLFTIVDGKITELFPFFYDTVRLQEIAAERRAKTTTE